MQYKKQMGRFTHKYRWKRRRKILVGDGWIFLFLIIFAVGIVFLLDEVTFLGNSSRLPVHADESESFREMNIGESTIPFLKEFSEQQQIPLHEILSVFMGMTNFHMETLFSMKSSARTIETFRDFQNMYIENQKEEYERLYQAYRAIISDIQYFPIPKSSNPDSSTVFYENGWGSERIYKDRAHVHEGCDIMAGNNERGYFPIISMTDGVVERIGWLEKGGYRIGIRSPKGGYFYYAHLYRYAEEFEIGDKILAGQLIGFMGDSGYSKVEGTVGNFAVHLHLGIYIQTEHYEEQSVNPYWILRYFEENRILWEY